MIKKWILEVSHVICSYVFTVIQILKEIIVIAPAMDHSLTQFMLLNFILNRVHQIMSIRSALIHFKFPPFQVFQQSRKSFKAEFILRT